MSSVENGDQGGSAPGGAGAGVQTPSTHEGALKIQRACDVCRRKKSDGARMPRNRCSNCIAYRFECKYVEAAKKRGPPKGYIDGLENRLRKLEQLLSRICTEDDVVAKKFETHSMDSADSLSMQLESSGSVTGRKVTSDANGSTFCEPGSPADAVAVGTSDADTKQKHSTNVTSSPTGTSDTLQNRFFGSSSASVLIRNAMVMKQKYRAPSSTPGSPSAPGKHRLLSPKGPQPYTFPEPDLMEDLIDLYFKNVNIFLPLLHRPTFERSVAERQHLTDEPFGETLLLVCAVGCLYSKDPRIFLEGTDSTHSAGWKWFMQVEIVRQRPETTLYALQSCVLIALFLESTSAPQSCWTILGIGMRLAQDAGAHRKRSNPQHTVQDELWKRAFWVLLCLDRTASVALGRPCAIQDEDFDTEPPIECDDEYWEHPDPAQAFKQPPGKPSYVAYFNTQLKLCQIAAFMLRTIYSNRTSKILLGFVGQQWEQHIVAELDSALNKWIDSVPEHLRWEPSRDNEVFHDQSVMLYATYYHLQISIHRPFIPPPRKPAPMQSFPSLAICTNAARACSHVVDVTKRKSGRPMPHLQTAAFSAGTVLVMNIWGGRRSGINVDHKKEMVDVAKCMQALQICEDRWICTGRVWDLLRELARKGDLQMPPPSPTYTNKRQRNSDDPISPLLPIPSSGIPFVEGVRPIAGSRRVSSSMKDVASRRLSQPVPPPFSVPMYGEELGRLPIFSSVSFPGHVQPSAMNTNGSEWLSGDVAMTSRGGSLPTYVAGSSTSGMDASGVFSFDSVYQGRTPAFSRTYGQTTDQYQFRDSLGLTIPVTERVASDVSSAQRRVDPMAAVPGMVPSGIPAMWSQAPGSFEPEEWGNYLTDMVELTQDSQPTSGSLNGPSW